MGYALKDHSFHDLEDSYQYYYAIENNCDAIATINIRISRETIKNKFQFTHPKSL